MCHKVWSKFGTEINISALAAVADIVIVFFLFVLLSYFAFAITGGSGDGGLGVVLYGMSFELYQLSMLRRAKCDVTFSNYDDKKHEAF